MSLSQHPRAANQAQAQAALTQAVVDIASKFELTTAEVCVVLSTIQGRWVGYQLSDERGSKADGG